MIKLCILGLLALFSQGFYIAATPKLTCLHFKKDSVKTNFKFQTNADHPDQVAINLINEHGMVIQSFQQEAGQVEFDGRHPFKICFQTQDNTNKAVTIDVWSESESHVRGLAKKTEYF